MVCVKHRDFSKIFNILLQEKLLIENITQNFKQMSSMHIPVSSIIYGKLVFFLRFPTNRLSVFQQTITTTQALLWELGIGGYTI